MNSGSVRDVNSGINSFRVEDTRYENRLQDTGISVVHKPPEKHSESGNPFNAEVQDLVMLSWTTIHLFFCTRTLRKFFRLSE